MPGYHKDLSWPPHMKPHQDSPLCITPSDLACIDPVFYIPAMDLIMSLQGSYVEALTLYDDTWR